MYNIHGYATICSLFTWVSLVVASVYIFITHFRYISCIFLYSGGIWELWVRDPFSRAILWYGAGVQRPCKVPSVVSPTLLLSFSHLGRADQTCGELWRVELTLQNGLLWWHCCCTGVPLVHYEGVHAGDTRQTTNEWVNHGYMSSRYDYYMYWLWVFDLHWGVYMYMYMYICIYTYGMSCPF